jgi:hypothetical protein
MHKEAGSGSVRKTLESGANANRAKRMEHRLVHLKLLAFLGEGLLVVDLTGIMWQSKCGRLLTSQCHKAEYERMGFCPET